VVNDGGIGEKTYYVYDAGGQRVRKTTETQNGARKDERLYLGGFEVFRKYNGNGQTVTLERETLHIMDDKERIALVETRTQGNDSSPLQLIRYQFGNHLGSVSLELDKSAAMITYEEYTPYGSTAYCAGRSAVEVSLKRYRYTGMERDEETGLNYHHARYYATWLGRWTAVDPSGLSDGINVYAYVGGNPITKFDISGHEGWIGHLIREQREAAAQDRSVNLDSGKNKATAQARSVILDSGKNDDFTKWGKQFVNKNSSVREIVSYNAKKTVVQNYEEAAKKAGQNGTLIVSVGHGTDNATCSGNVCKLPDSRIGSIALTPDGKFKYDPELREYIHRGEIERKSDDTLLKAANDPKAAAKLNKNDRARLQNLNRKEAKLQDFLKIGKALRDAGVKKVVFVSCRVGNSTGFLQTAADTWGVDIEAFTERVGANQDAQKKAYLSLYEPKKLGSKENEIDPQFRVTDELPTAKKVLITPNPNTKPINPTPPLNSREKR
jgi:RHS repeat-associated protein